jgi:hypothetical protein
MLKIKYNQKVQRINIIKHLFPVFLLIFAALSVVGFSGLTVSAAKPTDVGFDQYGYNNTARVFNGTGSSWCVAGGQAADCLGAYSSDKLVMKWNAEWDRGNAEGWSDPNGYKAWENNEWNGMVPGGSGAVWKYKTVWVGACGADYTPLADGGYCIWGQFETIMDQGKDPSVGPGHIWLTHANPTGYGAYFK